jgi:hypothetical protein
MIIIPGKGGTYRHLRAMSPTYSRIRVRLPDSVVTIDRIAKRQSTRITAAR